MALVLQIVLFLHPLIFMIRIRNSLSPDIQKCRFKLHKKQEPSFSFLGHLIMEAKYQTSNKLSISKSDLSATFRYHSVFQTFLNWLDTFSFPLDKINPFLYIRPNFKSHPLFTVVPSPQLLPETGKGVKDSKGIGNGAA
jgi:hypothetical protein